MDRLPQTIEKLAFVSSETDEAERARIQLQSRYGANDPKQADVIVALGGRRSDAPDAAPVHEYRQADLWPQPRNRSAS